MSTRPVIPFSKSDRKFLKSVGISAEPTHDEVTLALAHSIAARVAPVQVKVDSQNPGASSITTTGQVFNPEEIQKRVDRLKRDGKLPTLVSFLAAFKKTVEKEKGGRKPIPFDDLVSSIRKDAPGRVTTVSYDGFKFALECGIDVWDYAETLTLQAVIRDHGTPAQQQRLKEGIMAGRWATEINLAAEAEPTRAST